MGKLTAQLKESQFDFVHHSQAVFKILMMALAFPGKVGKLEPINLATNRYHTVLQCMLSLLDHETSFAVIADDSEEKSYVAKYLEVNTGSNQSALTTADFVLCLANNSSGLFSTLKRGDLERPDKSATIFYYVDSISDSFKSEHKKLTFMGPGIQNKNIVCIKGLDIKEVYAWKQSRGDYPLGCDIYCVSTEGHVIGIPRSTDIVSIDEQGG
ncbi:MAG: phosphonate C-P lyase system protein PhnH [Spirochaetales bacterium]|nr:phosphonate C-P lyase system protein PhnH [Spirochaetales bacterium]